MLFKKRKRLRLEASSHLFYLISMYKQRLDNEKHLIYQSIDASDEVLIRNKVTESIYSFLIREAKSRQISK